jgi:hypothetical protein
MASNVQPKPFFSFFLLYTHRQIYREKSRTLPRKKKNPLAKPQRPYSSSRTWWEAKNARQTTTASSFYLANDFFFSFVSFEFPLLTFSLSFFFFLLFFFFLMVSKCVLTYFDPRSGWRWVPRTTTIKMIAHRMMDTHDRVSRATWWAALLVSLGQGSRFIPLHSISTAKHTHRATSSPFPEGRLNRCELRCAGLESSRVVVQT